MKDNDIYNYISKAEIFIYRLRSLYKNTSRQVIKSSEYKPYRFFEKRTIRIKSERPYCEMSRWHWVTIHNNDRLANWIDWIIDWKSYYLLSSARLHTPILRSGNEKRKMNFKWKTPYWWRTLSDGKRLTKPS